jgi:hypothetical protein
MPKAIVYMFWVFSLRDRSTFLRNLVRISFLLPCRKECGCEMIAKKDSVSMVVTVVSRSSKVINRMSRGNSTSADGRRRERIVYYGV